MEELMELINKCISIQDALKKEYEVISVGRNILTDKADVHLSEESFQNLINKTGKKAILSNRECNEYPYKLSFEFDDANLYSIFDDNGKAEMDKVIIYE